MKVLQICNKPPVPATDGGCIAMNNITQGLLNEGCEVKIVAINTPKHFVEQHQLPAAYIEKTAIELIFVDTSIKWYRAFINLFSTKSYNIERFYSKHLENRLIQILSTDTFDIIQLESLYVAPYLSTIKKYSNAKVVLRAHNVEHLIWKELAIQTPDIVKKWYLYLLANRLHRYENKLIRLFDGIACISGQDKIDFEQMKCAVPIEVIPLGIDIEKENKSIAKSTEFSLFHLGSMDWKPNVDGILWFMKDVWPSITKKHPNLKIYLAGRKMPLQIKQFSNNKVIVENEVKDALEYMADKQIMIVPLFSGSGIRVKIIEGMVLGKTIISTSKGATGIHYKKGESILIADNKQEFIEAITTCVENEDRTFSIGAKAKKIAEETYDNQVITKKLITFYQQLINKK